MEAAKPPIKTPQPMSFEEAVLEFTSMEVLNLHRFRNFIAQADVRLIDQRQRAIYLVLVDCIARLELIPGIVNSQPLKQSSPLILLSEAQRIADAGQ